MFRSLTFLLLLLTFSTVHAQNENDIAKYKTFGLVWGFLKYHHPEISKGKYDWDSQFIEQFNTIETLNDPPAINDFYKKWINHYGPIAETEPKAYGDEYFTQNEDYRWFDTSGFDDELKTLLIKLKNGKHKAGSFYVKIPKLTQLQDFSNEKELKQFDLAKKSHRMLNFFSLWNAIQYWNLNKYLFDEDWLTVPDTSLPEFLAAPDKMAIEKAKNRLISKLQDSHSWYMSEELSKEIWGSNYSPFIAINVNDSLIITSTPSAKQLKANGLELGDIITGINGKSVYQALQDKIGQYISSGNQYRLRMYSGILTRSNTPTLTYTILKKDGTVKDCVVQLHAGFDNTDRAELPKEKMSFPENIAYLWLGTATKTDLKKFFKANANKRGIILDMRNYPREFRIEDLARYLYPEEKKFTAFMSPSAIPGVAIKDNKTYLSFIEDPFTAGSTNKDYFKGKIALLVDTHTISQSEYFGLMVQSAPNCITIGEPTAGVLANVVEFTMPDGSKIPYTGYQAFYPDGTCVFKKGLKIGIPLQQSARTYDSNLIYKKAVEAIIAE